ncbi:hypothetical protein BLA29_013579 [Euroglyphus maynei]|uniref:Uncharacterized protein n=1 Tax=Euroglyphus maynei TaxID=6958 RepID=A0A1Y3AT50_EURMA|nr:hypothetical protein BLA29_013579 [Euroglyphus maynei]
MYLESITFTSLSCQSCNMPTPEKIRLVPDWITANEVDGIINDEWIPFRANWDDDDDDKRELDSSNAQPK